MALSFVAAAEAFHRWLEVERGMAPRTIEAYVRDVEEFRALHAEKHGRDPEPRRVDIVAVRTYLAALFGRNDASSIARKLSSLRAFFRFLVKRGEVKENPAALVRSPRRRRARSREIDIGLDAGILRRRHQTLVAARIDGEEGVALASVLHGIIRELHRRDHRFDPVDGPT